MRLVTHATVLKLCFIVTCSTSLGIKNCYKLQIQKGKSSVHTQAGFEGDKICVFVSFQFEVHISVGE